MPIQVSYPGVYVQEVPGTTPTTPGVSTSSTAFIDYFSRGPMGKATRVFSMDEFNRLFGGLHLHSESSYGLQQYFLNGGSEAWIIRAGDGTAKKAQLDIKVLTPGLAARFQWASEFTGLARKAMEAADLAAKKARDAFDKLQAEGATEQQREQGLLDLQSRSKSTAKETEAAAAATREAAKQAKASSDELAIAIAKAAAAFDPSANRTAAAAGKSAKAAESSFDASQANVAVIGAAQKTAEVAEEALRTASAARIALDAASQLLTAREALDAVSGAIDRVDHQNTQAQAAGDKTTAEQAAVQAALDAGDAVSELEKALDAVQAAASQVGQDQVVTDLEEVQKAIDEQAAKVSDAEWDAQTALELDDAKGAAQAIADAGGELKTQAGTVEGKITDVLKEVLDRAKKAADEGVEVTKKGAGSDAVVEEAVGATKDAIDAAKKAATHAKKAAEDARIAASAVGSAAVTLSSRKAVANAEKMAHLTADVLKSAKATMMLISQANMTALLSSKPAEEASAAVDTVLGALQPSAEHIQTAIDTAQAALSAGSNAAAAAESVKRAAVATSQITVQASKSADTAAYSARVAVAANEEASQPPTLRVLAANEGVWGDNLQVVIKILQGNEFEMTISEFKTERGATRLITSEYYTLINLEPNDKRNAIDVVNNQSKLVQLDYIGPLVSGAYPKEVDGNFLTGGNDGGLPDADQLTGASGAISALDTIEPYIFNLLCVPGVANLSEGQASVAIANAHAYCRKKRAFLIVDIPPAVDTTEKMLEWVDGYGNADAYSMAVYFPRLVVPDPLQDYRPRNIGPSGTMAGIYARTDTEVGVWKAPAGIRAVLRGAEVAVKVNDTLNGLLNPRGVNVLRSFPVYGQIAWGARTLAGADQLASEWKYLSTRRLMNYVEESIFQSLKWAVFQPNNSLLWEKIRVQVGSFLSGLFVAGAFQGADAASAYFVQCDGTTTTPVDIDMGVVNVRIGIAPVKPAEFIVLEFQQIAGQS